MNHLETAILGGQQKAQQEMAKFIGMVFWRPKFKAPTGEASGPEMLAFIRRNATRNMTITCEFQQAMKRWSEAFPLQLSGNMVSGDQCDLSGHPNPEY